MAEDLGKRNQVILDVGDIDCDQLLRDLACLHPGCFSSCHDRLVEFLLLQPPEVYYEASEHNAKRLIDLVDAEPDRILVALAWMRNELVVDHFVEWIDSPPEWAAQLYCPLHQYLLEAGWEILQDKRTRSLFLPECHALVFKGQLDASVVTVNIMQDETCPWCNRPLACFLDTTLHNPPFSLLGATGERLRILGCQRCTCFGNTFRNVDWNGSSSWSEFNEKPKYLPNPEDEWGSYPENTLAYSLTSRSTLASIAYLSSSSSPVSQVGGHPAWEQSSDYPECPSCHRRMMFVAQLHNSDVMGELWEGTYYMFLCHSCELSCVNYQQT